MIQTVVKRDGRIVGFNEQKIMAAIRKAMISTEKGRTNASCRPLLTALRHVAMRR